MTTPVYCETADLVAEASSMARGIGLPIAAELTSDPLGAAARSAAAGGLAAAICLHIPEPARAIDARHILGSHGAERGRVVLAAVSHRDPHSFGLASDLGFICVRDVAPVLAALALLGSKTERSWRANGRKLSSIDHARLERALGHAERGAGRLVSTGDEGIGYQRAEHGDVIKLGHGLAVAQALRALAAAEPCSDAVVHNPLPSDPSATRDVLFGPPRLLSDPASKAALAPFGLPMPQEELCSSPSRASSEAARIGFPVRISLASPDLRVWDYPELSVDGVDNAARVRDVYRQLLGAAQERTPDARVLGVTVTATTLARALIRVSARPAPHGRVVLRVGFSDPHGATAKDAICTVLPASRSSIERALTRLTGAPLLLGENAAERERNLDLLSQLFTRVAAFVDGYRNEVERLELHPVALLVGGGAEVREAAIEVTDAFVRELS
ncbi:MAG: Archaeal succinyl-CoA ligase [ADP-forming] beta chain [Myxococcaceae bacterium]|nr:Archaeal succinyl-CoA ligase [ADP-forming] beta chain [Myxococcaceae bacterium]